MSIQKVLVVDDSKTEQLYISDILIRNGMSVRTASSAEEALQRLEEEKPDLVLMDVVMPGQNGFHSRALSRVIRASQICPSSCAPVKIKKPIACGRCAKAQKTMSRNQ